jgi:SAM-dependent methyltransferase
MPVLNPYSLVKIEEETVDRYRRRYQDFGYDARTLGWGSREQQQYRFAQTLNGPLEFSQRSVIDIGCGFGDYLAYLREAQQNVSSYEGWDVNPDLVTEATKRYVEDSGARFAVRNLLDPGIDETTLRPVANIGVMLGVLNFNLEGKADNYLYSELAIRRAWALSDNGLIVDFLSSHRETNYPAEPWVFYHDPERMLSFAFTLSSRVTLKHNYLSIPQREFMLFIERE